MLNIAEKIKNKYINLINSQTVKTNAYHWGIQFLNLPVISKVYAAIYWPVIRRKSQNMPKCLVIEPYNVCNLECIMCPYPDMTREKVRMDLSLFKKIIDDAVDNDFRTLSLSLYNEPYMDKSIFEKISTPKNNF